MFVMGRAAGPLASNAHLAPLARRAWRHDLLDRQGIFSAFPGVRVINPLSATAGA
jgi:hypothetical protein